MDAENVAEKNAQSLAVWLHEQGVPASTCDVFEGNEIIDYTMSPTEQSMLA